jgi:hypothetical protein
MPGQLSQHQIAGTLRPRFGLPVGIDDAPEHAGKGRVAEPGLSVSRRAAA